MDGKPFFFDTHNFNDELTIKDERAEKLKNQKFSRTELEQAKTAAFNEGKLVGTKEIEDGLTKNILLTLQKIAQSTQTLMQAEQQRYTQYENETVHMTLSILRKTFPLFIEKYGDDELKSTIKTALTEHAHPQQIKIEIHENLYESTQKYIQDIGNTLAKDITLVKSATLRPHECRILWPDGGVICNRSAIAEKVFTIMNAALAERGVTVHDEDIQTLAPAQETDDNTGEP